MKRKCLVSIALVIIMLLNCILPVFQVYATDGEEIQLDSKLFSAINTALNDQGVVYTADTITHSISITQEELNKVTSLVLKESDISDLTGLEKFTALTSLDLSGNNLSEDSNLNVLNSLSNLTYLDLSSNKIGEIKTFKDTITRLTTTTNCKIVLTNQNVISVNSLQLDLGEDQTSTNTYTGTFEVPGILELAGYIKSAWRNQYTASYGSYQAPTIEETTMYYNEENNTVKVKVASDDGVPYCGLLKFEIYINDSETEARNASNTNPAATNILKGSKFTMYFVSCPDTTEPIYLPDDNLYAAVKSQLTAGQTENKELESYPYSVNENGDVIYSQYYATKLTNSLGTTTKKYDTYGLKLNRTDTTYAYIYCPELNILIDTDGKSLTDLNTIVSNYTTTSLDSLKSKLAAYASNLPVEQVDIEEVATNGQVTTYRGYKIPQVSAKSNKTLYEAAYDEAHILIIDDGILSNKITSLILNNKQIYDLTGIEKFVGLSSYLNVSHNYLENIQPIISLAAEKATWETSLREQYTKYLSGKSNDNLTYFVTSANNNLKSYMSQLENMADIDTLKDELKALAEKSNSQTDEADALATAKSLKEKIDNIPEEQKEIETTRAKLNSNIHNTYASLATLYNVYCKEYKLTTLLSDSANYMDYDEYLSFLEKSDASQGATQTSAYSLLKEMVDYIDKLYSEDAISSFEDDMLDYLVGTSFSGIDVSDDAEEDELIPDFVSYFNNFFKYEATDRNTATYTNMINEIRKVALYAEMANYCLIERMENSASTDYCYGTDALMKQIKEYQVEGIPCEYEAELLDAITNNEIYDGYHKKFNDFVNSYYEYEYDSSSSSIRMMTANACKGEYVASTNYSDYNYVTCNLSFNSVETTSTSYDLKTASGLDELIDDVLDEVTFTADVETTSKTKTNTTSGSTTNSTETISTTSGRSAANKKADAKINLRKVFEYYGFEFTGTVPNTTITENLTVEKIADYSTSLISEFAREATPYEYLNTYYKQVTDVVKDKDGNILTNNYRDSFPLYNQLMSLAQKLVHGNVNRYVYLEALKKLNVSYNAELSDISDVSKLTSLVNLNAESCYISDVTNVDWSALTKLRELNLGYNFISDISAFLNFNRLESLNLSNNLISGKLNITDEQYITLFGKSSKSKDVKLKNFDLSGNQITDITDLIRYLDSVSYGDYANYLASENTTNFNLKNQRITMDITDPIYLDENPYTVQIDLPPIFRQLKAIDAERTEFGVTSGDGRIEAEGMYIVVNTRTEGDKQAVAEVVAMNGNDDSVDTCIGLGSTVTVNYTVLQKAVKSITITPNEDVTVKIGEDKQFTATIDGSNLKEGTVTWSLKNNTSENTKIDSTGKLTVAGDEKASSIIVVATSNDDPTIVSSVVVTIDNPNAEIKVSVTPNSDVKVEKGASQSFTAIVTGINVTNSAVTWSVSGQKSASTTIDEKGTLNVAKDETATSITVRATTAQDTAIYMDVPVTITESQNTNDVAIVINPSTNVSINAGEDREFSAIVTPASLTDRTVTWSISGNTSSATKVDENGKVTIGSDESASVITLKATSNLDKTVSKTVVINVVAKAPEEAATVTVSPATSEVVKGNTQNFTATVTPASVTDKTVTWSVSGQKSTSTTIDATGKLTVAADETATTLTVTATSNKYNTVKGTATVTVKDAAKPVVNPTVDDSLTGKIGYTVSTNKKDTTDTSKYLTVVSPKTTISNFDNKLLSGTTYTINVTSTDGKSATGYMKTGNKVAIVDSNGNTVEDSKGNKYEYTVVVRGDVNGDGKADSLDSLLLKGYIGEVTKLDSANQYAADIDLDGDIDNTDLVYLLYHRAEVKNFDLNNK